LVRCCCAQSEKAGRTEAELASKLGEYQSSSPAWRAGRARGLVEFLDMADVFRFDPREAIKRLRSCVRPYAPLYEGSVRLRGRIFPRQAKRLSSNGVGSAE
jgi:hypothetical protein